MEHGAGGSPSAEELGPWLGVVAAARPRPVTGDVRLDDIRLRLATELFRERQRPAPDWLGPWGVAVVAATTQTLDWLVAMAEEAQRASRAPERVARLGRPDEDEVRIIRARLESAGIPLEEAVQGGPAGDSSATGLARVGGAIEESWLELEAAVRTVAAEWRPKVGAVRHWRRPTGPLWALTAAVAGAAFLVGLMIGGYLPAPRWAAPLIGWWWSLPWP